MSASRAKSLNGSPEPLPEGSVAPPKRKTSQMRRRAKHPRAKPDAQPTTWKLPAFPTAMDRLKHALSLPLLAPDAERSLTDAAQAGDRDAIAYLVHSHLKLGAKRLRFSLKTGDHAKVEDLIQHTSIGLLRAIDKFEPERNLRFATFAQWYVKAEVGEAIYKDLSGKVSVPHSALGKAIYGRLKQYRDEYASTPNKAAFFKQLALIHDSSPAVVQRIYETFTSHSVALDAPLGNDGEYSQTVGDLLVDEHDYVSEALEATAEQQRAAALYAAMHVLNAREKDVLIHRRLKEPHLTLDELADAYGVSRERIRQIEVRAISKVKAELDGMTFAA